MRDFELLSFSILCHCDETNTLILVKKDSTIYKLSFFIELDLTIHGLTFFALNRALLWLENEVKVQMIKPIEHVKQILPLSLFSHTHTHTHKHKHTISLYLTHTHTHFISISHFFISFLWFLGFSLVPGAYLTEKFCRESFEDGTKQNTKIIQFVLWWTTSKPFWVGVRFKPVTSCSWNVQDNKLASVRNHEQL